MLESLTTAVYYQPPLLAILENIKVPLLRRHLLFGDVILDMRKAKILLGIFKWYAIQRSLNSMQQQYSKRYLGCIRQISGIVVFSFIFYGRWTPLILQYGKLFFKMLYLMIYQYDLFELLEGLPYY